MLRRTLPPVSLILLAAAVLPAACGGGGTVRTPAETGPVAGQRILLVPHAPDERNRYGVERMAERYAQDLRDTFMQVLALWTMPDPALQRRVRVMNDELATAHVLQHFLPPEVYDAPWMPSSPDLIGIFEVADYGQSWDLYDPIGQYMPLEIIRLDPHLERETLVSVRVTFYEAESGLPLGRAIGEGSSDRAEHGRGFDWTESRAVENLAEATQRLLRNWYEQKDGAPVPSPVAPPDNSPED